MRPILSILIPSVPERSEQLHSLLDRLKSQAESVKKGSVEVLVLTDLCTLSLGEKRNKLMHVASGMFFIHLDDDDRLVDEAFQVLLPILLEDPNIDVVAYDQRASLNGEDPFVVHTSIDFENEQAKKDDNDRWVDVKRKPWHWCCWNAKLARQADFVGRIDEDWQWLQRVIPKVTKQYKLNQVLHEYYFNEKSSLCKSRPDELTA